MEIWSVVGGERQASAYLPNRFAGQVQKSCSQPRHLLNIPNTSKIIKSPQRAKSISPVKLHRCIEATTILPYQDTEAYGSLLLLKMAREHRKDRSYHRSPEQYESRRSRKSHKSPKSHKTHKLHRPHRVHRSKRDVSESPSSSQSKDEFMGLSTSSPKSIFAAFARDDRNIQKKQATKIRRVNYPPEPEPAETRNAQSPPPLPKARKTVSIAGVFKRQNHQPPERKVKQKIPDPPLAIKIQGKLGSCLGSS